MLTKSKLWFQRASNEFFLQCKASPKLYLCNTLCLPLPTLKRGETNLSYVVYILTYGGHVIRPFKEPLAIKLPSGISTRCLNLCPHFKVAFFPKFQCLLCFVSPGLNLRVGVPDVIEPKAKKLISLFKPPFWEAIIINQKLFNYSLAVSD